MNLYRPPDGNCTEGACPSIALLFQREQIAVPEELITERSDQVSRFCIPVFSKRHHLVEHILSGKEEEWDKGIPAPDTVNETLIGAMLPDSKGNEKTEQRSCGKKKIFEFVPKRLETMQIENQNGDYHHPLLCSLSPFFSANRILS